jgi:hypothetical protein
MTHERSIRPELRLTFHLDRVLAYPMLKQPTIEEY